MKTLYLQCALLCLVYMNTSHAMDVSKKPDESTQYIPVQVDVPLAPATIIAKQVNLQVPSKLVTIIQNQKQSEAEILTGYIKQRVPELRKVLAVFTSLMCINSTGQSFQVFGPMASYDPTLFGLLKAPQTHFFYLCDNRLILDWPLGIHDGWRVSHNVTIEYLPEHPRKGTRSEAMVEFENRQKNKHFTVALPILQTQYKKAGKKTMINQETVLNLTKTLSEEEFTKLHAADMIAIALHYIANHAK